MAAGRGQEWLELVTTTLRITLGDAQLTGTLNDNAITEALLPLLPLEGEAHAFGGELALCIPEFECPDAEGVSLTHEVVAGTLAYWKPGKSLMFYCGATPLSRRDGEGPLIASSPVLLLGAVEGFEEVDIAKVDRIKVAVSS